MFIFVALIRNVTKSKPICLFFYLLVRKGSRKKNPNGRAIKRGEGGKGQREQICKNQFLVILRQKKVQAATKLEEEGGGLNGPAIKHIFFCGFPSNNKK